MGSPLRVVLSHLILFGAVIQQTSMAWAGFEWGVAVSSHQVEGGNSTNDWHRWESECRVVNCERSGRATDHWNLYETDFDLARSIDAGVFRTSLEWSRIEPAEGQFSTEALAHYRRMLQAAKDRGLKVMLTLHHFTLPLWVADYGQGGWKDPRIPDLFAAYSRRVVAELGDLVDYWITVNEPNVNMLLGFVAAMMPPGLRDHALAPRVMANFLKAHAKAYHIIHERFPGAKVSFSHHVRIFDPANSWNPMDRLVAGALDDFWNHQPLRSIQEGVIRFSIPFVASHEERCDELRGTLDYLGINYYTRDKLRFSFTAPQKFEIVPPMDRSRMTDVDWEIYPEGLERLLVALQPYGWPLMITENGLADATDAKRARFLCEHVLAMKRAMDRGVPVIGYIHWSLTDNFEWSLGFAPRFGLVAVDYGTMARTPRPSARIFQAFARGEDPEAVCRRVLANREAV